MQEKIRSLIQYETKSRLSFSIFLFFFPLCCQIDKLLATKNQIWTLKCNFILNHIQNLKVIVILLSRHLIPYSSVLNIWCSSLACFFHSFPFCMFDCNSERITIVFRSECIFGEVVLFSKISRISVYFSVGKEPIARRSRFQIKTF